MQTIFRQRPEENVVIEINNLLASKHILKIEKNEVTAIIAKYKIDVHRIFVKNLYEFYAVFLNHCLADSTLDNDEQKQLLHLRNILGLTDYHVDYIHAQLCGKIYRKRFEAVIRDGRLSDENNEMLDKLESNLKLPAKTAEKISGEVRSKFVHDFVDVIVSSRRMSPVDEKELIAISKSLKVDLKVDRDSRQALDRYKLFWKLENDPLIALEVEINLQKGECCYFTSVAEWHEDRTNRGERYWKMIDRGDVFLTNKRVIFSGRIKNTAIALSKILSFTELEDGVQLNKDTGKSPRLGFKNDSDLFKILLPRVMKENGW